MSEAADTAAFVARLAEYREAYEYGKRTLWQGIRDYVLACGGDPDKHVRTDIDKELAEAMVECGVRQAIAYAKGFRPPSEEVPA